MLFARQTTVREGARFCQFLSSACWNCQALHPPPSNARVTWDTAHQPLILSKARTSHKYQMLQATMLSNPSGSGKMPHFYYGPTVPRSSPPCAQSQGRQSEANLGPPQPVIDSCVIDSAHLSASAAPPWAFPTPATTRLRIFTD